MKLIKGIFVGAIASVALAAPLAPALAQAKKPNILIIWGDDIGGFNISAYNHGMMGYKTPNIDSIAAEGAIFTDWYGQQSCTAGRAAFVTGQSPIRTGLTKVGLPGAPEGMQKEDPTIATLLKAQGYVTGQFGKNHLGDRDEMLPTAHGFDEFFGNLYHLNAEEEPENPDYPKNPEFKKKFGPRGVIHSFADGTHHGHRSAHAQAHGDDRRGSHGQGARLHGARREGQTSRSSCGGTRRACTSGRTSRRSPRARPASGVYPDGMVEHDGHVGQVLAKLKELGLDENTIVMYSTDNGAETMSWPDGGTTMFRGEKNTNWEGGYRVPTMIKWPGVIKPGTVDQRHRLRTRTCCRPCWPPPVMQDVKEDLMKGRAVGGMNYKVHLDGYDLGPCAQGRRPAWPRNEFIYWTDDGSVAALRYGNWKMVFLEQRGHGFDVWQEPFVALRLPKLFNLRSDPFERADHEGMGYPRWRIDRAFLIAPAGAYVGPVAAELPRVPAAPEAGQLQPRPRDGSGDHAGSELT